MNYSANIWLIDLSSGGASIRFTFSSASDTDPVWSPDGSNLIFSSNRDGHYDLYQKATNGGKGEVLLLHTNEDKHATSWSRDGRFLLYTVSHAQGKSDLWVLPLSGEKKPAPLQMTDFNERQGHFSPDGRWVAYVSDESGTNQVYVRSLSTNSAVPVSNGGKFQVSKGTAIEPRWGSDDREIYYLSLPERGYLSTATAMVVEIATHPTFELGKTYPLGALQFAVTSEAADLPWISWDSAPDGGRFIGLTPKTKPGPYTVVLNWQAGLSK